LGWDLRSPDSTSCAVERGCKWLDKKYEAEEKKKKKTKNGSRRLRSALAFCSLSNQNKIRERRIVTYVAPREGKGSERLSGFETSCFLVSLVLLFVYSSMLLL